MKLSYKTAVALFFIFSLIPIFGMWFLVYQRIETRQVTLQLFLQNAVDLDRRILAERQRILAAHDAVVGYLMREQKSPTAAKNVLADFNDYVAELEAFWKRYDLNFTAERRPFLLKILERTQESALIEEERVVVEEILRRLLIYASHVRSYPSLQDGSDGTRAEHNAFFDEALDYRTDVFVVMNQLADIRFIYNQRVVFFISGENERQQGFFNSIFVALASLIFVLAVMEYFFIHKPFKDIMLFLRDLSAGKRGQRLYFSSPVREIKESEEIINQFVSKSEEHEKET